MSNLEDNSSKSAFSIQENKSSSSKLISQTEVDEITLQNLPAAILNEILSYFSYGFCLPLRKISISFHNAVTWKFRVGYKNLLIRIRKKVRCIEFQTEQLAACLSKLSDGEKILGLMMHHSVLKILESEAEMLNAICHRYIEKGMWNFVSSYGARLLDQFHGIITLLVTENLDVTHIDSTITSELMFLCGHYLDYFMVDIEPTLDLKVPFEVKLADILGSCYESTVKYNFSVWDIGYRLNISYYLNNLSSIQLPWDVSEHMSTEEKLQSILKTMKNNIRYRNYCYPLRETWLLEDIFDVSGINGLKNFFNEPNHYHSKGSQELPCYKDHNGIEWQVGEDGWTMVYDEIYHKKPYTSGNHSVEVIIQLDGGPKPLKFQDLEGRMEEEIGICDIHLHIQHPPKCGISGNESYIRIEGKNGIYSIDANDQH